MTFATNHFSDVQIRVTDCQTNAIAAALPFVIIVRLLSFSTTAQLFLLLLFLLLFLFLLSLFHTK
jgi:hypothetical protein